MKKIILIAAGILFSAVTHAQIVRKQPKAQPMPKVQVKKPVEFTLDNGLTVMVVEDHKLPRVSFSLSIDTPPIYEGAKSGVMSLTSAVLGNGTTKTTKEKFNEEIDFLGASINFANTGASASGLSKYTDKLLNLMVEGAFSPLFEQSEFDKAKEKAIQGLKSEEKSVSAIKGRVVNALIYGKNHPRGEYITKESLEGITLDDIKSSYKKYFVPGNAYLVVIGDVEYKSIKKKITKLFSDWEAAKIVEDKFVEPVDVSKTEINFIDVPNAVQSEIVLANVVNLKATAKDYFAALMANQILGGGGEGRLFLNLREAHAWTYGAYSSLGSGKYTSSFRSSSSVRNSVTDSAVVEFMNELHKITSQPVKEKELALAKAKYIGNFVMNIQKPSTIAGFALSTKTSDLPHNYYENYIKNIEAVTVQDVQRAAQKYFRPNNTRVIIVGKGSEVVSSLTKLGYDIKFFDKFANPIAKPVFNKKVDANITAKSVFKKYIDAVGGAKEVKKVRSLLTVSSGTVQGAQLTLTTKKTNDKMLVSVEAMGMVVMKQVITPTMGYIMQQGQRMDLKGDDLKKAQESIDGLFGELNMINDSSYKLKTIENFNGEDAYVVNKGNTTLYYSVATGYKLGVMVETEMQGNMIKNVTKFSDYKVVEGVKIPHKTTINMGQDIELSTTSVKINKGVSNADFK